MCTSKQFEYDVFESETMLRDRIVSVDDISPAPNGKSFCKVCGTREIQVCLRNKNKYCKICFLPVLMHKFKATLGKSKAVRSTDSILIAHSGKVNSTVLVHLVKDNFSELASKRIPFQCKVLYIDDGMVKGRTIEERQSIRNALAKEAETTRLLTYIVPFSEYTDNNIYQSIQPVNMSQINTTESDVAIEEIFRRLESDTAKDELLRQLRRKLIVSAARALNCNKVFVADASVDLAVKVLGNVSTGRGSQLPFDVAFSDLRCADVVLLRPLKDFTRDDINGYLDCCQLYPVISSEKYNYSFATSIRTIAKNFVSQLDTEFYGTVPTIYRTSEKLAIKLKKLNNPKINASIDADIDADADADANADADADADTDTDTDTDGDADVDDDNNTCILCEMALERCRSEDGQLSVIQAKSFSKLVSTTYMNSSSSIANSNEIRSRNHMKEEKCCCLTNPSQKQSLQSYVLKKYLCYSCSLIFLDKNRTHITLPNFMLNAIRRKMHSMCLRNEISDFLL